MGKPKKRNAYFYYMLDFKDRERERGNTITIQEAQKLASESWDRLSLFEKERYKQRAEDWNKNRRDVAPITFRNKPIPQKILTPKETKIILEKEFIENYIRNLSDEQILDQKFYIAHVNIFCRTDGDEDYYPAEIAISRSTLRDGPTGVFHRFLHPGEPPYGYYYDIKKHTESTHGIPLDYMKSSGGYIGLYNTIIQFLKDDDPNGEIPPIYTMYNIPYANCSMSAVQHTMKKIWETQNFEDEEEGEIADPWEPWEKVFRVFSLSRFFFLIKNKCVSIYKSEKTRFEEVTIATRELLKDKYAFDLNIACKFHQENHRPQFCSQSYAVRWARVIRDECLGNLVADMEIEEEEEEIKQDQFIKSERDHKDHPTIKTEKDLKIENDEFDGLKTVKTERDCDLRTIKNERVSSNSHPGTSGMASIKTERDPRQIKIERESSNSSSQTSGIATIKTERDPRPIKIERESSNSSSQTSNVTTIKTERDPRPIKIERESSNSSSQTSNVATIKTERDPRPIKTERESSDSDQRTDRAIKTEKLDPSVSLIAEFQQDSQQVAVIKNIKIEKQDSSNSQIQVSSADGLETKTLDIPYDPIITNIKTEKVSSMVIPKLEQMPIITNVKSEKPDSHVSVLKTEHIDIPDVVLKTERNQEQSPDPRISIAPSRDPRIRQSIPPDEFPKPIPIKNETSFENVTIKQEKQSSNGLSSDVSTIPIEKEPIDRSSNDFPLPIPIKNEPAEKPTSDFPLPIPIKPDPDAPVSENVIIKSEPGQTDLRNITIKTESQPTDTRYDSTNTENPDQLSHGQFHDEITHIKMESMYTERDTNVSQRDDFRFPNPIKMEPADESSDFPLPIPIKMEFTDESSDFPLPIKIENDPDAVIVEKNVSKRKNQSLPMNDTEAKQPRMDIDDISPVDSAVKIKKERISPDKFIVKNKPDDV